MAINFPKVPTMVDEHQSYTTDGKPNDVQAISLGVVSNSSSNQNMPNFSSLIGTNVTVPIDVDGNIMTTDIVTTKPKRSRKKKNADDSQEVEKVSPRETVENTVYADEYSDTNAMTNTIIAQADGIIMDCAQDIAYMKSQRSMKGKYHYINETRAAMNSALSTKLAAIKERNATTKAIIDNEYRRYKDMRAADQTDDNKAIMDAYSAFISAPVGAPAYVLPNTVNLTGGSGVIRQDYPPQIQAGVDAGMQNYMSHLTPEQNLMLNDNNPDIEEVIVYDQATGAKYFQWMNTKTGEAIPNMPITSNLVIEDYTIDPRTHLAKNTNLNSIKKVVVINNGEFNNF
jgi:hypothetical protein